MLRWPCELLSLTLPLRLFVWQLQFTIVSAPARGQLFYSTDAGVTLLPVTSGQTLPQAFETRLWFRPEADGGGSPYATFTYSAVSKPTSLAPCPCCLSPLPS